MGQSVSQSVSLFRSLVSQLKFRDESEVIRRINGRVARVRLVAHESRGKGRDAARFTSSVKDVVKAASWICVHKLSLESGGERLIWFCSMHLFVSRYKTSLCYQAVCNRVRLSIEVSH